MRRSEHAEDLRRRESALWEDLGRLVDSLSCYEDATLHGEGEFDLREYIPEMEHLELRGLLGVGEKALWEAERRSVGRAAGDHLRARSQRQGDLDEDALGFSRGGGLPHVDAQADQTALLLDLQYAVRDRDIYSVKDCFARLRATTGGRAAVSRAQEDSIAEAIGRLNDAIPLIIFRSVEPALEIPVPQLLLQASSRLADMVSRNPQVLHSMSPRQFEELIAELFDGFGYVVELTARTRDGGRDVVAIRSDQGILSKLLIECKRWSPSRHVGLAQVRELYAVKTLEKATKAVLATTSTFSRDARRLESQLLYELELKDFQAVTEWAKAYTAMSRGIRGL